MTRIQKELSVLMLAQSFLNMYLKDIYEELGNYDGYEEPIMFANNLSRINNLYAKNHMNEVIAKNMPLLEQIESESKKHKPEGMFNRKLRFTGVNIDVNGLLFAATLVMQHKNLQNRILHPDYKLAYSIYETFELQDSKGINNSRILAKKFVQKIKDL